MAKRKKKKKKGRSGGSQNQSSSMGRWLEKQLLLAERLEERGAYEEAFELLLTLEKRYPRHRNVVAMLVNVASQMQDWNNILQYSLRLYPLETDDDRALALNNVIAACMELNLPGLACQSAEILLADHPNYHLIQSVKEFVEGIKPHLFEHFLYRDLLLEKFGDDEGKMLAFMAEYDRMTFSMDLEQREEAISSCRRLLALLPGFSPALNNISLDYFRDGKVKKAIETAKDILTREPDNVHALGNLVRYCLLNGEIEAARNYALKMKQSDKTLPDHWLKQAEALAYLSDDEGVRDTYLAVQRRDIDVSLPPMLLHLAAAAHYRLGDESKAWRLWQEALRIDPSFLMAKMNLAERAKAPGERHAGWYWPLRYWFAGDIQAALQQYLPSISHEKAVKKGIQKLLKRYPQLPKLAPHILLCADPAGCEVLISLIKAAKRADLSKALFVLGLSKQGPDMERMNAFQFLVKHHPEMLPANRRVVVWHQGELKDILLLGVKITRTQRKSQLDDETYNIFLKAHRYLNDYRHLKRAEEGFTKVINASPDFPAAYNQLMLVYQLQDRHKEAEALVKLTHERFPDYIFSRIALARMAIREERFDEARELLNPVLIKEELHVSEFRALAQAEILLALGTQHQDIAHMWLTMWQNAEETHPDIPAWKARIEGRG